jgi:hypothetical protein
MATKKPEKPEKKQKPPPEIIIVKTEVRPLPVKLTQDEQLERAQQLADTESRMREHESHSESVKKDLKAKEQSITSERSRLAGIVKAKQEPRDVRVSIETHEKTREYIERREDTDEVIFRRPLRPEEMQKKLDLGEEVLAVMHPADPGKLQKPNAAGDFPADDEG